MTSGQFHSVELSSIKINREARQRRELENLDELSDSLRRIGLINPIVITRDLTLVAGERRLESARLLGWSHITCHYTDELTDSELRTIELEENVKRQQLPWQDECLAVLEYHNIMAQDHEGWSQHDTARALGYQQSSVSQRISVAEELLSGNVKIVDAPRFSTAVGIVARKAERLDEEALAEFKAVANIAKPATQEFPESIHLADFNEWAPTYTGPKFNFIHCDFPYGIGADKFNQGSASLHGGYDDSEETYWRLCLSLCNNLDRLCTDSAHIMFWFSFTHYQATLDFFRKHSDFALDIFPLIWHKTDNIGTLPDPQRGPRRIYETALYGSRGDRKIVRAKSNCYGGPTVRDVHMSIKPEPMLRNFFEMFVDESTIFLDPTCGSGSSVRAADSLNAAHVVGLERNPEFHQSASKALRSARTMRRAAK